MDRMKDWTTVYIYYHDGISENEYGKLKVGDIVIHFICKNYDMKNEE